MSFSSSAFRSLDRVCTFIRDETTKSCRTYILNTLNQTQSKRVSLGLLTRRIRQRIDSDITSQEAGVNFVPTASSSRDMSSFHLDLENCSSLFVVSGTDTDSVRRHSEMLSFVVERIHPRADATENDIYKLPESSATNRLESNVVGIRERRHFPPHGFLRRSNLDVETFCESSFFDYFEKQLESDEEYKKLHSTVSEWESRLVCVRVASSTVTEEEIAKQFSFFGPIRRVSILHDSLRMARPSSQSYIPIYLEFYDKESADRCTSTYSVAFGVPIQTAGEMSIATVEKASQQRTILCQHMPMHVPLEHIGLLLSHSLTRKVNLKDVIESDPLLSSNSSYDVPKEWNQIKHIPKGAVTDQFSTLRDSVSHIDKAQVAVESYKPLNLDYKEFTHAIEKIDLKARNPALWYYSQFHVSSSSFNKMPKTFCVPSERIPGIDLDADNDENDQGCDEFYDDITITSTSSNNSSSNNNNNNNNDSNNNSTSNKQLNFVYENKGSTSTKEEFDLFKILDTTVENNILTYNKQKRIPVFTKNINNYEQPMNYGKTFKFNFNNIMKHNFNNSNNSNNFNNNYNNNDINDINSNNYHINNNNNDINNNSNNDKTSEPSPFNPMFYMSSHSTLPQTKSMVQAIAATETNTMIFKSHGQLAIRTLSFFQAYMLRILLRKQNLEVSDKAFVLTPPSAQSIFVHENHLSNYKQFSFMSPEYKKNMEKNYSKEHKGYYVDCLMRDFNYIKSIEDKKNLFHPITNAYMMQSGTEISTFVVQQFNLDSAKSFLIKDQSEFKINEFRSDFDLFAKKINGHQQ